MADRVGLAMTGCGWGATDLYAPTFKYLEQGELIGCFDLDRERAQRFAEAADRRAVVGLGRTVRQAPRALAVGDRLGRRLVLAVLNGTAGRRDGGTTGKREV